MPIILDTPKVETKTVTTFVITNIENNVVGKTFTVRYDGLAADDTLVERGTWSLKGTEEVQAFYLELDIIIATGKTFEEASKELLYSKIAIGTLV